MADRFGYHTKEITKGVFGETSKIREELDEAYRIAALTDWAKANLICVERDRRRAERTGLTAIQTSAKVKE